MKLLSRREIVFRSLTFAEPAMVFIFDEFLDEDELGVRNVPDGLSELSWETKIGYFQVIYN